MSFQSPHPASNEPAIRQILAPVAAAQTVSAEVPSAAKTGKPGRGSAPDPRRELAQKMAKERWASWAKKKLDE